MKYQALPLPSLLFVALSAAFAPQAFAAAGTAQFTAGDVQVKRADGGLAPLSKGKDIDSGQSVVTGTDGRAQVRFTDGGLISLQPNTEFKIASYVDKLDGKEDRFLVDLLRGSMRAITGLIGKRNRDNYKVNTATATIGIRGSGFNVSYNPDGTLSVSTELDAIEVCTATGCVGLTAGESVKVLSNTRAPVRTNVRAAVPTPPPAQEALIATQQAGALAQFVAPPVVLSVPLVPDVPTNIDVANMALISYATDPTNISVNPAFDAISRPNGGLTNRFDPNGRLLSITDPSLSLVTTSSNLPGDVYNRVGGPADADFLSWGTWTQASQLNTVLNTTTNYDNFSYVTGRPTGLSPLAPTAGIATYTQAGGTVPIFRESGGDGLQFGTFNSATLTVDFGASSLFSNVSVSVSTSLGDFIGVTSTLSADRTFVTSASVGPTYRGFLIGPTANRAGITYSIPYTPNIGLSGFTTGAVGFVLSPN